MPRYEPTPEEQEATLRRLQELLGPGPRRQVVARPARRGRRWYWSLLWPEPLPVRRWPSPEWRGHAQPASNRFEWGHRIGFTFVSDAERVEYAAFRRDMLMVFSYDYLRQQAGYLPVTGLEEHVRQLRVEFGAVWDVMTPAEREAVGLPDIDGFAAAQAAALTSDPAAARTYLRQLMAHRPTLVSL